MDNFLGDSLTGASPSFWEYVSCNYGVSPGRGLRVYNSEGIRTKQGCSRRYGDMLFLKASRRRFGSTLRNFSSCGVLTSTQLHSSALRLIPNRELSSTIVFHCSSENLIECDVFIYLLYPICVAKHDMCAAKHFINVRCKA